MCDVHIFLHTNIKLKLFAVIVPLFQVNHRLEEGVLEGLLLGARVLPVLVPVSFVNGLPPSCPLLLDRALPFPSPRGRPDTANTVAGGHGRRGEDDWGGGVAHGWRVDSHDGRDEGPAAHVGPLARGAVLPVCMMVGSFLEGGKGGGRRDRVFQKSLKLCTTSMVACGSDARWYR